MKTGTIREDHMVEMLKAHSPQKVWIPSPDVQILFMFIFMWSVKSLYKFPSIYFFPSSDILMFFCSFGGRFCYSFNHSSTSLFFPPPIYLHVQTNKTSHLSCPAGTMILLSAVNKVKLKPQTKPSWGWKKEEAGRLGHTETWRPTEKTMWMLVKISQMLWEAGVIPPHVVKASSPSPSSRCLPPVYCSVCICPPPLWASHVTVSFKSHHRASVVFFFLFFFQ